MAANVDAKLLKQTKFPPEFNTKVDMNKVNIEVMKKWIAGKISDILGNEDDVVIELCFNLIEGSRFPNIKHLQIQLTGFLDKDTPKFCKDLWNLCLSAQSNPQGVPKELLEAKKLELIQEKVATFLDAEKAAEEARQRKEEELAREREMEAIRRREREERAGGGRNRRDYGRRNFRDSHDEAQIGTAIDVAREEILMRRREEGAHGGRMGEDAVRQDRCRVLHRFHAHHLAPSHAPHPVRFHRHAADIGPEEIAVDVGNVR
ncbi:PWI domain containing protein [Coccidioides posadasii C735 delta SOWgp]|uniref:PWI domain containing protein n=1 Tax=Coccidioides posadasii (strain C735) TaxID=222929 RepID=C5PBB7_COCP7|nr:PWI domain containing protein [Coccidioides posadasii C735 delta SOWgp]EER25901.1 PWI domain containing protein [Coccidioides posadasii C735 delta SOWgp]|eukprot:XP_003068046.1 PWI domain containing protein [Coccidioides posadasii C735 delta SOWgp]